MTPRAKSLPVLLAAVLLTAVLLTLWFAVPQAWAEDATKPTVTGVEKEAPTPADQGGKGAAKDGGSAGKAEKALALPKGVSALAYKGGLLTLKAEGADAWETFKAVSAASGVEFVLPVEAGGALKVDVQDTILPDALRHVLAAAGLENHVFQYAMEGKLKKLAKVTVLPNGAPNTDKRSPDFPEPGLKRSWTVAERNAYLTEKYGPGWRVDRIKEMRRFRHASGPIPLILPFEDKQGWLKVFKSFYMENPDVFPVRWEDLKEKGPIAIDGRLGQRSVNIYYDQYYNGVKISSNPGVGFSYEEYDGKLHITNNLVYPSELEKIPPAPTVTMEQARAIAIKAWEGDAIPKGKYKGRIDDPGKSELKIVIPTESSNEYKLAWRVEVGSYVFTIDAVTGVVLYLNKSAIEEQIEYQLLCNKYGRFENGSYVLDGPSTPAPVDGVKVLQPPNNQIAATSDADGKFNAERGLFPLIARLDGSGTNVAGNTVGKFKIYNRKSGIDVIEDYQIANGSVSGTGIYTYKFQDDNDGNITGYQPNVYLQINRGLTYLNHNDGVDENTPVELMIKTAADGELGGSNGSAYEDSILRYNTNSGKYSTTILHELMHAAVFKTRGEYLFVRSDVKDQFLSEAVADYYSRRIDNNPVKVTQEGSVVDYRNRLVPSEAVEPDDIMDYRDWQDYESKYATTALLWEINEQIGDELQFDKILWGIIKNIMPINAQNGLVPEDIYEELSDRFIPPPLLWTAFSHHGMNLYAVPTTAPAPTVCLNWYDNYGAGGDRFVVARWDENNPGKPDYVCRLGGTLDQCLSGADVNYQPGSASDLPGLAVALTAFSAGDTTWTDESTKPDKTYKYVVYPYGSDGVTKAGWIAAQAMGTNPAFISTGAGSIPYMEIISHKIEYQRDGNEKAVSADVTFQAMARAFGNNKPDSIGTTIVDAAGQTVGNLVWSTNANTGSYVGYIIDNKTFQPPPLKDGKYTYEFTVTDNASPAQQSSAVKVEVTIDSTPPPAILNAEVHSTGSDMVLTWTSPETGFDGSYQIFVNAIDGVCPNDPLNHVPFTEKSIFGVKYCLIATVNAPASTFTDTTPGRSYFVRPVDVAGNPGDFTQADKPLDIALVIDRSGSMAWDATPRIERAYDAASLFLELVGTYNAYRQPESAHRAGIASFGFNALGDYGGLLYTPKSDPACGSALKIPGLDIPAACANGAAGCAGGAGYKATLDAVRGAVESANPQATNIIAGLSAAGEALETIRLTRNCQAPHAVTATANPAPTRGKSVFLLTDGDHNFNGGHFDAAESVLAYVKGEEGAGPLAGDLTGVYGRYPKENTPIYSVKLAEGVNTAILTGLSDATGGYYDKEKVWDGTREPLERIFLHMLGKAAGLVNSVTDDNDMGPGETRRLYVSVDSSMKKATFAATWGDPAAQVSFTLKTPSGLVIDPVNAAASQAYYSQGPTHSYYHLTEPEAGTWEFVVRAGSNVTVSTALLSDSMLRAFVDFDRAGYVQGDSLVLSGHTGRRKHYMPLIQHTPHIEPCYCYRCPYGKTPDCCGLDCAVSLERALLFEGPDSVAAFIAEPVVGASAGALVPHPGYWPKIREICDRYRVLLIADEVMTGVGRTGMGLALNHWGVGADLVTLAKGLSSGYAPLGAVLARASVHDAIAAGSGEFVHGFTYCQHPVSIAAGAAVMKYLKTHGLIERSASMGSQLLEKLKTLSDLPVVGDVRGLGLMAGIEFVLDRETRTPFPPERKFAAKVAAEAFKRGLITYPGSGGADGIKGDHLLLCPPFIVTVEELDFIVETVRKSIVVAAAGA